MGQIQCSNDRLVAQDMLYMYCYATQKLMLVECVFAKQPLTALLTELTARLIVNVTGDTSIEVLYCELHLTDH